MKNTDRIPADLRRLQQRFEHWRETREKQTKIPECLLAQARALLAHYPITLICRVCRLHPHSLRQAPAADNGAALPDLSPDLPPAQAFLAWPAAEMAPGLAALFGLPQTMPERRLVFARPDGATLTLTLTAADTDAVTALCAQFLRV